MMFRIERASWFKWDIYLQKGTGRGRLVSEGFIVRCYTLRGAKRFTSRYGVTEYTLC